MLENWTFGRKLGLGFGIVVLLAVLSGGVAAYSLAAVVAAKDRVIAVNSQALLEAQRLQTSVQRRFATGRGYILNGDAPALESFRAADEEFTIILARLRSAATTADERAQLDGIAEARSAHLRALEPILALRAESDDIARAAHEFDVNVTPRRVELVRRIDAFSHAEEQGLDAARRGATDVATQATSIVISISVLAALLAVIVGAYLSRTLSRQIGSAVGRMHSSSAELQAAANQQATSAREQATAMSEITTTISELLATSRQIAESAQRVAQIATQTAVASRAGDLTVGTGQESIAAIRRQVDVVVGHMLDLGKKSQQVGAVLEIVAELAEQTNILAINATIEAAGAGDAGRRFAVVADEIRKLADRVAGSTKEIRGLIEDVRSAVNTTVMTTEIGSKAVDAGARHFADVASSFKQISGLVAATTDAAKEIELSTRQQTTAVEQVKVGTTNIAQAANETEVSTTQTLQTASQLALVSRDLLRLVQAGPAPTVDTR